MNQTLRCVAKIALLIRSPRHGSKKAAAEGAAIWFIQQLVVARAARSTFGECPRTSYSGCRPTTPQVSLSSNVSIPRTQSISQGGTSASSTMTVSQMWCPYHVRNSSLPPCQVSTGSVASLIPGSRKFLSLEKS